MAAFPRSVLVHLTAATVLLVWTSAARTELLPGARPIVDHYVTATGGAEALEREQVVRTKGHVESMGLSGTWELVYAAPDRWVRSFRLGPLRFREGFDGHVAWQTDLSEKAVTVLSQAHANHAKDEGWFLTEQWARVDQGGGRIRPRSTSYGPSGISDILEITSPGGEVRVFSIDRKTGLPSRVTGEVDTRRFELRPARWKTLRGRKRWTLDEAPRLIADDRPVERMTVDSAFVSEPFDSTKFSPPGLAGRAIAWKSARDTVVAPMTYSCKTVLVRVSINGAAPEDFMLDTGADMTVLDEDYARQIGLKLEGQGAVQGIATTAGIRWARVGTISVRGRGGSSATLHEFKAAVLDLAEGEKMLLWRKLAGVLGADFLSRFAVRLDYDARTVTFYDPATFHYEGGGAALPMELFGGVPAVDVVLNGKCPGKFIVDVGNAFHFTVHGTLVRSCSMMDAGTLARREVEVAGGGAGGGFVGTLCRLDSLRIGPFAWADPVAALTLHTRGMLGSHDVAGNIGNTVLERFRTTIDYEHHMLYLEPGKSFPERERVSRFGALFAKVGTKVYAGNVLTGSAAYEAGLRWYDEIVAVDGRPLEKWTREEVDRLLEEGEAGSVHQITYRRLDDPEKTVEVTLRDVL
jgi:hypothetical protein